MNNYYQKINLPENIIKEVTASEQDIILFRDRMYGFFDPYKILSDEVLDLFSKHNLKPKIIVGFGKRPGQVFTKNNRIIHSDVENEGLGEGWKNIVCGINFEYYPNHTAEFSWYDVGTLAKFYPPEIKDSLNGIHYGSRSKKGIHEGVNLLETTVISGPTLVRTDIPHQVTFDDPDKMRLALSIRFHETWSTWEEALEAFKPLLGDTDV